MKKGYFKKTRIICMVLVATMLFLVSGCSEKTEQFDLKKKYKVDDVTFLFRGSQFTQTVSPINPYGEGYEQSYEEEDNAIMVDLQFYVDNKSDKKVDLKKLIHSSFKVDHNEMDYGYYLETKNYASVEEVSTLKAKEKSILHLIYFMDKPTFENMSNNDKEIQIIMNDITYTMALKEHKVKEYTIKDKKGGLEDINLNVISSSSSKMIPPLNGNENSNWYIVEDEANRYVGMYMEIENTSDQPFSIVDDIYTIMLSEGEEKYVWNSLLSEDLSIFVDEKSIPANSKRTALFFGEVKDEKGAKEYTFKFYIEGVPYIYTFGHEVFN